MKFEMGSYLLVALLSEAIKINELMNLSLPNFVVPRV